MHPANRTARLAGALYLSLLPLGILGLIYVPANLIVPGDAAATVGNISTSESVYRLSIVAALLTQSVNILVVLALHRLLQPVNRTMANLMAVFILLGAPIAMLSELNRFAVLLVTSGAGYLSVFGTDQLQALALFFLELHEYGIGIASIFWGLWLFPMGYLVYRSGFLPRIIGILLMIGCFGYLIDFLVKALLPDVGVTVSQFTFVGEILLPLWLLIRGVDTARWVQLDVSNKSV